MSYIQGDWFSDIGISPIRKITLGSNGEIDYYNYFSNFLNTNISDDNVVVVVSVDGFLSIGTLVNRKFQPGENQPSIEGKYGLIGFRVELNHLQEIKTCDSCKRKGNIIDTFLIKENPIKTYLCADCLKKEHTICEGCSGFIYKDETKNINGANLCSQCSSRYKEFTCGNCNETNFSLKQNIYKAFIKDTEVEICRRCRADHFVSCNDCGRVCHRTDFMNCEYCHDAHCSSCNESHFCDYMQYRKFDTTPITGIMAGTQIKSSRYAGCELEIVDMYLKKNEFNDENREYKIRRKKLFNELDKKIGITHDGSLSLDSFEDETFNGIEIVLPPASKNKLEKLVTNSCKVIKDLGFGVNRTCGTHVHISAEKIKDNPKNLTRMIKTYYAVEDLLFSLNPPSRWDNEYCIPITRRYCFDDFNENFKLEEFESVWYAIRDSYYKLSMRLDRNWLKECKSSKYQQTRYCALNLHALNRGTVEFRHHAGTLNAYKLLGWISVLQTIVDYAVDRYDEEEVVSLLKTDTGFAKLELFFEIFKATDIQKEYMKERVAKFNTDFKAFHKNMSNESDRFKIYRADRW